MSRGGTHVGGLSSSMADILCHQILQRLSAEGLVDHDTIGHRDVRVFLVSFTFLLRLHGEGRLI